MSNCIHAIGRTPECPANHRVPNADPFDYR